MAIRWFQLVFIVSGLSPFFLGETLSAQQTLETCQACSQAGTERFWVVSTRNCKDTFDHGRPCCQFEIFESHGTRQLKRLSHQEFLGSLDPNIPVCLQVHGSFTDFTGGYFDSIQTVKWLRKGMGNRPCQFVFFSWPSYRKISILPQLDVGVLGRRAARHGLFLADLINSMPAQMPVCLLAHSHGTRVAASGLHLMGGGSVQGLRYDRPVVPRRLRTVLGSSALDHHWLNPGERYDRAICATELLVNFRSRHDCALSVYPLRRPFSRLALGTTGLTKSDRRALSQSLWKIREFDLSNQLRFGHNWPRYYEKPGIAMAIVPYMQF